jgi:hypothetical protein
MQMPIANDGILPAFPCLKIVMRDTINTRARSSAVSARSILSLQSARLSERWDGKP